LARLRIRDNGREPLSVRRDLVDTMMKSLTRTALIAVAALIGPAFVAKAQDLGNGQRIFNQCRACHQVGERARNAVGPVLNGLFGRKAGSVEGYSYSQANQESGLVWDEETFADYIKNPRAKIPGTKMIYAGLKDENSIRDLVAFLKQFDANGKRN
jgi:cytochrome c